MSLSSCHTSLLRWACLRKGSTQSLSSHRQRLLPTTDRPLRHRALRVSKPGTSMSRYLHPVTSSSTPGWLASWLPELAPSLGTLPSGCACPALPPPPCPYPVIRVAAQVSQVVFSRQASQVRQRAISKLASHRHQPARCLRPGFPLG